jgi:glutamyl-tRNA synthetase
MGYLPEAMVNFLAFLGWNPGDDREIFTISELIAEFDFDRVQRGAPTFNKAKLDWYNQQYIKSLDDVTLAGN